MVPYFADFHALAEWLQKYPGLAAEARSQVLAVDVLRECEGVARLLMRQPPLVVGYTSQNQVAPMGPISAGSVENFFEFDLFIYCLTDKQMSFISLVYPIL